MKWIQFDPAAFLEGCIGLDAEERGFYATLIALNYARAPRSDVTDELVIKAMACRPQVWRRIKVSLIAKGKVHETDAKLTANRVETELKLALNRINKTEFARTKSLENRQLGSVSTAGKPQPQPQPEPDKKERSASRSKERRARTRTLFPENWTPEIGWDETEDFEHFADHARTNARLCANWEAAWRNWKRKTVELKQKDRQNGRRHGSVLDAGDRLAEKLRAAGATDNYIPGSSGPRPLALDQQLRTNGPKLISSR